MGRVPANTDVFAAISDPTRRSLLDQLRQGELPVKQLAAPFDMSMPAISQHLSILCEVGLVSQRRVGRQRFYRLVPEPLQQVSAWLSEYDHFWQDKLASLGAYLDESSLEKTALDNPLADGNSLEAES